MHGVISCPFQCVVPCIDLQGQDTENRSEAVDLRYDADLTRAYPSHDTMKKTRVKHIPKELIAKAYYMKNVLHINQGDTIKNLQHKFGIRFEKALFRKKQIHIRRDASEG